MYLAEQEILQALAAGKKIRRKFWRTMDNSNYLYNSYIEANSDGIMLLYRSDVEMPDTLELSIEMLKRDDWEII